MFFVLIVPVSPSMIPKSLGTAVTFKSFSLTSGHAEQGTTADVVAAVDMEDAVDTTQDVAVDTEDVEADP